jgi:DNA-binding MarR family transcriptional regulator
VADTPSHDARAAEAVAGQVKSLDPIVHERMRLGILCVLAASDGLAFTEVRDLLGLTDGNLSVHARRLEEAAYIASLKEVAHRTSRTRFRLTPAGRKALEQHLARLASLGRTLRP